jgi:protein-disulfide isomerase
MNLKSLVMFGVITLVVLFGVGGLLWQFGKTTDAPIEDIAGEMRYKQGSGAVTLVEFSDFQCPACQSVHLPLKQMLAKYEGKVQFVYRHFPLTSIHKNAQLAAQASEAAHQQGKFWEWHNLMFEKQTEWAGLADPHEKFLSYAKDLGLDEAKFSTDLESEATKGIVTQDLLASSRYRLTGTPTFFLNGVKVEFNQLEAKLAELTQ